MPKKKSFEPALSPLFETRSGNLSAVVTEETLTQLERLEEGGRILVKYLSEETRNKSKSDNPPVAYLEYISKETLDELRAQNEQNGESI